MPETLSSQHIREIASAPRSAWWGIPGGERISRHIARSEAFAESSANGWGPGVYSLFEEMEDKDAHLYSILQTRKNGVLARPRKIEPASTSEQDRETADWLSRMLNSLPHWDGALLHLLDSLAKGMAVIEIIWGYDAAGRIVPVELKPRSAGRFSFGDSGELLLSEFDPLGIACSERPGNYRDTNRPLRMMREAAPNGSSRQPKGRMPERKFMLMLFGATDERQYGRGLCERVYWYWWFKKNNLKFWVMYNEKFGAPTVVAKHSPGLSSVERDRLLEIISSLQADAGVTLPEGITLQLLESNRRGSAETYQQLANWCNEEMSRGVLGQTLTVGEGTRGGSFALAKVHEAVRFDYMRTDACMLMDAVNSQLVRWMIDFNFGESFPAPSWRVDLSPEVDQQIESAIDRQLLQMGVPLPLRYFYEKYGRPVAAEGERQLRYDDNNLYQYHLQFGVLTVNEVRASLGLRPVPWGDRLPTPAASHSSDSPTPLSGGGIGRSEDANAQIDESGKDTQQENAAQ